MYIGLKFFEGLSCIDCCWRCHHEGVGFILRSADLTRGSYEFFEKMGIKK